jgi:hypothetical protein
MIGPMPPKYLWILFILVMATTFAPLGPVKCWGAAVPLPPESIAMGEIGACKLKQGTIVIANTDSGRKAWSADLEDGWLCKSGQPLRGMLENALPVQIKISMKSSLVPAGGDNNHHDLYTVVLNLELENRHVSYHKKLSGGNHREMAILNIGGEKKVVELSFYVMEYPLEPLLSVSPRRLDFGTLGQGQKMIKKIEITNRGRQALKWKIRPKNNLQQMADSEILAGRYVSFLHRETRETGPYQPGNGGKESAEFTGPWSEVDGYPEAQQNSVLKYRFSGAGVILYYWKSPAGGKFSLYLDNRIIANIDTFNEQTVAAEYRLPEPVVLGTHTLTLVNNLGRVVIEGVKIVGREIARGEGKVDKNIPGNRRHHPGD